MKSKKRHQTSSEDSEQSDASEKSTSTSESDSEESSSSEHHRYKKKRKRADSSDSESDSDDQKRVKKRKHKKKKKKHGKKKRRHSIEESMSGEDASSVSDGEISSKKKRKHKHKHKRARSISLSDPDEWRVERRLHSVVERRASSEDGSQPSRTYYQKECRRSASGDDYDREREMQRFYRGSSKERRHYQEQYERDRNDRRHKYEEQRPQEEYRRRPREDHYHPAEEQRGYNHRYNQYEDKGPKRRVYEENIRPEYRDRDRDRERRGHPEQGRYREREYPDRREKFREEDYIDRQREVRRDRQGRTDKSSAPREREQSRSRSPEDRQRDRSRRPEVREKKEERYREREERDGERAGRNEDRDGERAGRNNVRRDDRRDDRREDLRDDRKPTIKLEPKTRERKSRFADADDKEYNWGKTEVKKEGEKNQGEKEKPNFGLSGKLTADANTVNGVVIKYTEPDDAKQPKRRWRFYPFKGDKALPILYIHRQSAFLIGRDKKVADIALEHPSISKQHAALQYRATPFVRPDGTTGRRVRPYVIDLDSANGTFVNNKKIEPRRYVELLERDVVKFGFSQREYVLLHENSKDDAQDDDHQEAPAIGDNVTTTEQIKQDKRVKQELAEDGE
ncbi:smad nuclear-interacting protein 1 isoform X2 [Galleria mellonella]|uniref:Smad nuclear-interacting protein 1 isoform X2 n=1 Tax=Galleria mellonella TaxID=7137 RepID=A0A6J1WEI6_GALME|nr:smad nuclear-interacting protein 1 isoform X2 [Galleria mellonella]